MVAKQERQHEWQELVAQWRAIGLSQRAFALGMDFPETDQLLVAAFGIVAAVAAVRSSARRCGWRV
jgi:hypothetical protein